MESPDYLTGLEIAVTDAVDGEPVGFCLDSLTTLLQYVDDERAYRFVHALTARLAAADARHVVVHACGRESPAD